MSPSTKEEIRLHIDSLNPIKAIRKLDVEAKFLKFGKVSISDTQKKFFSTNSSRRLYILVVKKLLKLFQFSKRVIDTWLPIIKLFLCYRGLINLLFEKLINNRFNTCRNLTSKRKTIWFSSKSLYHNTCDQQHVWPLIKKCRRREIQLLYFFLDLSKALDPVNHRIFLQKLKTQSGIGGTPLELLKIFFNERQ